MEIWIFLSGAMELRYRLVELGDDFVLSLIRNYAKTYIDKTIHRKYTLLLSHPRHLQMSYWDFDEIFSMACTDGGKTGLSLSTVSKRIRIVSKVFKYQTLRVKQTQLCPLTRVLHSLPLDARRVVHLYILSSNSRQLLFGYHYDHFFDIDKNRVLTLVAHSLHMLKVVAYHSQLLLPIPLPSLRDLTLRGGIKVEKCMKRGKACYPALKCFQLSKFRHADEYNLFPLIMNNALTLGMIKLSCGSFKIFLKSPLLSKLSSVPAIG